MLNLKVSKLKVSKVRSEASKNKVIIKHIKHIDKLNNQSIKFSNITKKHITKNSRNSKLKEKYYINEKTHLTKEKNLYFIIP